MGGHGAGDLIKGADNAIAVETLIERKSRYFLLAKLAGASAAAVLDGITRRLRTVTPAVRKTLPYDQGKEMARHQELAQRLYIRMYFGSFLSLCITL